MKKVIVIFLIISTLLCSCSRNRNTDAENISSETTTDVRTDENGQTTSPEDLSFLEKTTSYYNSDEYIENFINKYMKRYSEKEIEANKELYYRNQNKDYLKIPTLEDGINGYIDSIGTYNWLMNHYCTQEEFVISKYNTLVGYNGDDKNIVIPDNVERIEKFALRGISYKQTDGADSVYIHKNLNLLSIMESGISTKAFIVDKDNSVFCDIDGVLCNKKRIF